MPHGYLRAPSITRLLGKQVVPPSEPMGRLERGPYQRLRQRIPLSLELQERRYK